MHLMLIRIWQSLSPREKIKFYGIVMMMIFGALMELVGIGLIMPVVALLTNPSLMDQNRYLGIVRDFINPSSTKSFILVLCVAIAVVYALKNIFLAVMTYAQTRFVYAKAASVSKVLFDKYVNAPYTFHLKRNPSDLLSNFQLIDRVYSGILLSALMLVTEAFVIALIFLMLMFFTPAVTAGVVVVSALTLLGMYYPFKNYNYKLGIRLKNYMEATNRNIMQSISGIKEIKVGCLENRFSSINEHNQIEVKNAETEQYFTAQIPSFLIEILLVLCAMGVLVVFVLSDMASTSIILKLSLVAAALMRLMPSFSRIQYNLARIRHSMCGFDSILDDIHNVPADPKYSQNAPVCFKKEISVENISFSYPDGKELFSSYSLNIPINSSVAFVGTTGCGKTTLIDIIIGILKPSSGRILVDGRSIEENMASWQEQVGYVPQFIYLSDDTVKGNVAFGIPHDRIDEKRVRECLEMAQILSFVESLPESLDTFIGERGIRLSGGQRQRIGIARALYRKPSILVLDEATSALDNETEKAFVDALAALKGKLTILIVAHRLTTVENCDKVVSLP